MPLLKVDALLVYMVETKACEKNRSSYFSPLLKGNLAKLFQKVIQKKQNKNNKKNNNKKQGDRDDAQEITAF